MRWLRCCAPLALPRLHPPHPNRPSQQHPNLKTRSETVRRSFHLRHQGPLMLAKSLVDEIDRLLREGNLSQRKIAAQLQVSRGTVSAIASGRRGLYGHQASDGDATMPGPHRPPQRCRRCGHRVYMPCLICRSRDFRLRQGESHRMAPWRSRPAPAVEIVAAQTARSTEDSLDGAACHAPIILLPTADSDSFTPAWSAVQVLTLMPAADRGAPSAI